MILVCPSCDSRYYTDASALGESGRQVRCAACGHSWFAKPSEDGAAAVSERTGLTRDQVERLRQTAAQNAVSRSGPHAEIRAREAARRQRNRMMARGLAWAAGFLMFVGAAAATVAMRNEVANAWPQTASIYRLFGLDVNRFGLEFDGVDAKRSFDGTTPVLTVTGWAVNHTETEQAAPRIRISLRDESGDEVQAWTERLPADAIAAGERIDFSSRIYAPPVETYSLVVSYAPNTSGAGGDAIARVKSEGEDEHAADQGSDRGADHGEAGEAHESGAQEPAGSEDPGYVSIGGEDHAPVSHSTDEHLTAGHTPTEPASAVHAAEGHGEETGHH